MKKYYVVFISISFFPAFFIKNVLLGNLEAAIHFVRPMLYFVQISSPLIWTMSRFVPKSAASSSCLSVAAGIFTKLTWQQIERGLSRKAVTVAAGPGLSLPPRAGAVELKCARRLPPSIKPNG